VPDDLRLVGES
jgi:hypothetical protein